MWRESLSKVYCRSHYVSKLIHRSRKQLKAKIQLWREQSRLPHENIDKSDMDHMVLVNHLRKAQGLKTAFKHYGFLVHGQKVEKHRQRWGVKDLNPDGR